MSDRSEMEVALQRPRHGTINLSILIEFICQKVYTDLMRLVDLLPSKTDLEKKIEIATFFSRTQHLFVRLEALVKWANSASKVDKCEKISNFLEEQSFFLLSTANVLSRLLRETLVGARLPPFSVFLGIDVFTNRSYTRLPKSIKDMSISTESISRKELKQALLDLNRVIQNRLSLTQLPRQFETVKIANGRVHFVVPNEFTVTLTLMSEAIDFPWRILDIQFLIKDPSYNYQSLVHPAQTEVIRSQAQSRLLYRQFDKRPPLIHLYDMLHMLHEQIQRAKLKRPADSLNIECYRPGQNLSISYWHALARTQFHSVMGLDGKIHTTAYLLSIYVDPTDPQRPLCVSHRPELPASKSHIIGTVIKGNHLSIESLLMRTVIARAEKILMDLKQELLIFSPGPVRLADAPLCLYFPLLWPCDPHELLQIRIDPLQGLICASFPLLTSLDTEFGATGPWMIKAPSPAGLFEGYSRASVLAALNSLETAFNQASTRRTCFISSTGSLFQAHESEHMCSIQSKSLRNLSNSDTRWRSVVCKAFEHLRMCLGLARLMQTAKIDRPFWLPFKRHLPFVLSSVQIGTSSQWSTELTKFQQSNRFPILFVQLFPNNEYYIACEVTSRPLSVDYKYYLLVCTALPEHTTVCVNSQGVITSNMGPSSSPGIMHTNEAGLYLKVTHFAPLQPSSVWSHNPLTSVSLLRSHVDNVRSSVALKRSNRITQLLDELKRSSGLTKQPRLEIDTSGDSKLNAFDSSHAIVSPLARLIGNLEESILSTSLTLELSNAGIEHTGIHYDGGGCLSAIRILKIPTHVPSWQPVGLLPLSEYVHEIILRPHFDPFTHRRDWQLDLVFTGFTTPLNGVSKLSPYLRHQTANWIVTRLEDFAAVAHNILLEWERLCCMHALCHEVVINPELHLAHGVDLYSYTLKSLSLVYASVYMVEISHVPDQGFVLAFGFRPPRPSASETAPLTKRSMHSECNPHSIIRYYLEELLNMSKSIRIFTQTLMYTLDFFRAIENLTDPTLSYHGLKLTHFTNTIKPVRGMYIIALSTHDLIFVYRASLSLRITLTPLQQSAFPVFNTLRFDTESAKQDQIVTLIDGYPHLMDQKTSTNRPDAWGPQGCEQALNNLVPLPAFQMFLKNVHQFFRTDSEVDSPINFTVAKLTQISQPSSHNNKIGNSKFSGTIRRSQTSASPLESYLSASLLFHSALLAAQNMNAGITTDPSAAELGPDDSNTNLISLITRCGSFNSFWPACNLTAHVALVCQAQTTGILGWKLALRLSANQTHSSSTNPSADCWLPETLSEFEEFFDTRVCVAPFQPSAVTAFFRLLTLPSHVLRDIARVLAFDLRSTVHAPAHIRLGLVGIQHSNIRLPSQMVGASGPASSPHTTMSLDAAVAELLPGHPGIVIRPPRIILQLLVMRTHSQYSLPFHRAELSTQALKMSSRTMTKRLPSTDNSARWNGIYSRMLVPLAQLILVTYDWDANRVAILTNTSPPSAPAAPNQSVQPNRIPLDPNSNLLQILHDADVESKANQAASTGGDSALVKLVCQINPAVAAYPISSVNSGSGPPYPTGPNCMEPCGMM